MSYRLDLATQTSTFSPAYRGLSSVPAIGERQSLRRMDPGDASVPGMTATSRFGGHRRCQPSFSLAISPAAKPKSPSTASVSAPSGLGGAPISGTVREKRGAGAGCSTPSRLREGAARDVVGMVGHLAERQDRRHAGVAAREDALPLVARLRLRWCRVKRRRRSGQPLRSCCLGSSLMLQAELLDELLVEALLDGADRQPLAVLGLIDVVPGRAACRAR